MKTRFLTLAIVVLCAASLTVLADRPTIVLAHDGGQTVEMALHLNGAKLAEIVNGEVSDDMVETMGIELYFPSDELGELRNSKGFREYGFRTIGVRKPDSRSFVLGNQGTTLRGDKLTIDFSSLSCRMTPFLVLKGQEKKDRHYLKAGAIDFFLNGVKMPWSEKYRNNPVLMLGQKVPPAPTDLVAPNVTLTPYILFEAKDDKLTATVDLTGISLKAIGIVPPNKPISFNIADEKENRTVNWPVKWPAIVAWKHVPGNDYAMFVYPETKVGGNTYCHIASNMLKMVAGDGVTKVTILPNGRIRIIPKKIE
jgi:hypothetical protein